MFTIHSFEGGGTIHSWVGFISSGLESCSTMLGGANPILSSQLTMAVSFEDPYWEGGCKQVVDWCHETSPTL